MSGLEDLFAQIPTSDIASKIGVDEAEVNKAVQLLVPVLVGGLHENAQDPDHASKIEAAADTQRAGRRRRGQQRPAQAAAADPGADRSGIRRKATDRQERSSRDAGSIRRGAQRRVGQHPRRDGRQQVAGQRVGQCAGLQGGRHPRRIARRQEVNTAHAARHGRCSPRASVVSRLDR